MASPRSVTDGESRYHSETRTSHSNSIPNPGLRIKKVWRPSESSGSMPVFRRTLGSRFAPKMKQTSTELVHPVNDKQYNCSENDSSPCHVDIPCPMVKQKSSVQPEICLTNDIVNNETSDFDGDPENICCELQGKVSISDASVIQKSKVNTDEELDAVNNIRPVRQRQKPTRFGEYDYDDVMANDKADMPLCASQSTTTESGMASPRVMTSDHEQYQSPKYTFPSLKSPRSTFSPVSSFGLKIKKVWHTPRSAPGMMSPSRGTLGSRFAPSSECSSMARKYPGYSPFSTRSLPNMLSKYTNEQVSKVGSPFVYNLRSTRMNTDYHPQIVHPDENKQSDPELAMHTSVMSKIERLEKEDPIGKTLSKKKRKKNKRKKISCRRQRELDELARIEHNRMLIRRQTELATQRNNLRAQNQISSGAFRRMCFEEHMSKRDDISVECRAIWRKCFLNMLLKLKQIHKKLFITYSKDHLLREHDICSGLSGSEINPIENTTEIGMKMAHENVPVQHRDSVDIMHCLDEQRSISRPENTMESKLPYASHGVKLDSDPIGHSETEPNKECIDKPDDCLENPAIPNSDICTEENIDHHKIEMSDEPNKIEGEIYRSGQHMNIKTPNKICDDQSTSVYEQFMKVSLSPYILVTHCRLVYDILRSFKCHKPKQMRDVHTKLLNRVSCMFPLRGTEDFLDAFIDKVKEHQDKLYDGLRLNSLVEDGETQTDIVDGIPDQVDVESSTKMLPERCGHIPFKRIPIYIDEDEDDMSLSAILEMAAEDRYRELAANHGELESEDEDEDGEGLYKDSRDETDIDMDEEGSEDESDDDEDSGDNDDDDQVDDDEVKRENNFNAPEKKFDKKQNSDHHHAAEENNAIDCEGDSIRKNSRTQDSFDCLSTVVADMDMNNFCFEQNQTNVSNMPQDGEIICVSDEEICDAYSNNKPGKKTPTVETHSKGVQDGLLEDIMTTFSNDKSQLDNKSGQLENQPRQGVKQAAKCNQFTIKTKDKTTDDSTHFVYETDEQNTHSDNDMQWNSNQSNAPYDVVRPQMKSAAFILNRKSPCVDLNSPINCDRLINSDQSFQSEIASCSRRTRSQERPPHTLLETLSPCRENVIIKSEDPVPGYENPINNDNSTRRKKRSPLQLLLDSSPNIYADIKICKSDEATCQSVPLRRSRRSKTGPSTICDITEHGYVAKREKLQYPLDHSDDDFGVTSVKTHRQNKSLKRNLPTCNSMKEEVALSAKYKEPGVSLRTEDPLSGGTCIWSTDLSIDVQSIKKVEDMTKRRKRSQLDMLHGSPIKSAYDVINACTSGVDGIHDKENCRYNAPNELEDSVQHAGNDVDCVKLHVKAEKLAKRKRRSHLQLLLDSPKNYSDVEICEATCQRSPIRCSQINKYCDDIPSSLGAHAPSVTDDAATNKTTPCSGKDDCVAKTIPTHKDVDVKYEPEDPVTGTDQYPDMKTVIKQENVTKRKRRTFVDLLLDSPVGHSPGVNTGDIDEIRQPGSARHSRRQSRRSSFKHT